jgi:endonuclease/exonuclease/phosphatase (EEP) superfamily protein YafD
MNSISRPKVSGLIQAAGFLTALLSFATVLNSYHQHLELFSHFRIQYLVVTSILLLLFLLMRRWKYAVLMLATAVLNVWFVVPWHLPQDPVPYAENWIKLVHANVHAENNDHYALQTLLAAEQPDIVFLQEVDTGWAATLETLDGYPYRHIVPRYDFFGIAVLSRIPLESIETVASPPHEFPTLVARIMLDNAPITLISTHPMPPMTTPTYDARNTQLASIAELVNDVRGARVLIGDLNTAMWGEHYRQLVDSTGLRNVREGFGTLPTWPTFMPFAMIPIDHCLVSKELLAGDVRLGADIGSDHRPLVLTLQLTPPTTLLE